MRRVSSTVRTETLGRLLEVSIHDLSNIFTAVGGYAHLLGASHVGSGPESAYARSLVEAADRGTELLVELRRVARDAAPEPGAIELNEAVSDVAGVLGELAGDRGFSMQLGPDVGRVRFDAVRLERVLVAYALNACLAGEHELVVSTDSLEDGRLAAVSVGLSGALPPLPVDDGHLPADGVGLALAHGLVVQAGGQIAIEPGLERPRSFAALLPALQ